MIRVIDVETTGLDGTSFADLSKSAPHYLRWFVDNCSDEDVKFTAKSWVNRRFR